MSVSIVGDGGRWDRFVEASPDATLFHRWPFLKIVEKHSGFRLIPLMAYRGSEPVCAFPIFHRSLGAVRMVFSPPPGVAVPHLGPILGPAYDGLKQNKKEAYLNAAIEEIEGEIAKLAPNYVFVSAVLRLGDARPFQWSGYDVRVNYTYVLDLQRSLEEIWEGFSQECRKRIKSCGRYDIAIERTADVPTFYRIMTDRLGEKGMNSPIPGESYLEDLLAAFPDNVKMYFVYSGEDLASVALHCEHKGSLMLWMGDINVRRDIPVNEYTLWEFIKDARARGVREIDFEGAAIRQICQYKSKFNPALRQHYHIFRKDLRGSVAEWAYKNLVAKKITVR